MGGIILKHSIIAWVYQLSCTRELTIGVAVNVKAELELNIIIFKALVKKLKIDFQSFIVNSTVVSSAPRYINILL